MADRKRVAQQVLATVFFGLSALALYHAEGGYLPASWPWYAGLSALWAASLLASTPSFDRTLSSTTNRDNDLLETVARASPVLIWRVDRHGVVCEVLGRVKSGSGLDKSRLLGKSINTLRETDPDLFRAMQRALSSKDRFTASCGFNQCLYRHHFLPIFGDLSQWLGFHCVSVDISSEQEMDSRARMAEQVFANTADAVVILDRSRRATSVNRAFCKITGFEEGEILGIEDNFAAWTDQSKDFYASVFSALADADAWHGEVTGRRKSGELFAANMGISAVRDDLGQLVNYVVFLSDLSHIKRKQQELSHLAHHDSLTDLPNRRLFLDRLDQGVKRAERNNTQLAIFFIDLDNFKASNDTHGHDFGDELLREVGRRLLGVVRQSDTVARFGGDEFILIAENVRDATEITAIARKILACFDTPIHALGRTLAASASVGIGVYPQDGKDLVQLMRSADQAMYRAKAEGRNGFYSLSGPTGRVPQSLLFPAELRMALKRDQLQLVYQPMLDAETGQIRGCEALLRWGHHARGVVSPLDFMPMSEEAGLTAEIGFWTLNQACLQLSQWHRLGIAIDFVAVNIALSQVKDASYADLMLEALGKHNLSPASLMVEIPEKLIHTQRIDTSDFIARMHAIGVRCAIDDFGSTSANYSYVKDVPVDAVKIYQQLLASVNTGKEDLSLLRALVSIADVLGKVVVAVGVESPVQQDVVQRIGCSLAQGYLYAKPMSSAAIASLYFSARETSLPN